jgi:hypothetical protein
MGHALYRKRERKALNIPALKVLTPKGWRTWRARDVLRALGQITQRLAR